MVNYRKTIQSDLRTNIRPLDSADPFDQENVGAHFETIIDLTDKTSSTESRFLTELGDVTQTGILYAYKSIYYMEHREWIS